MSELPDRIGILADVHANEQALEVALETLDREGVDGYFVLGDLIGYNASPQEVMDRLMDLERCYFINGNHDRYLTGETPMFGISREVVEAIKWTRRRLSRDHVRFLENLTEESGLGGNLLLVHGSPRDPDEYITTLPAIKANLSFLKSEYPGVSRCFFGHSHIPVVATEGDTKSQITQDMEFDLSPDSTYLMNVGSVGQPRDGCNKAAFGLFDRPGSRLQIFRREYPIKKEQKKIRNSPLSDYYARRLELGE